jgi:hypothetical protein
MGLCLRGKAHFLAILAASVLPAQAGRGQGTPPRSSNQPEFAKLTCIAQPATALPGDPVIVQAQLIDLTSGSRKPVYLWSSTGGIIKGNEAGARIDTARVAPGDYVITGHVVTGRGKAHRADCITAFRVVPPGPPTLSCTASPASIVPGGFTTITARAISPQNRSMTYSYGTAAGQITGTGPVATLAATDVNPGPLKVTCNVVDDHGQATSTSVIIDVRTPPPPPLAPAPAARKLCSASFERDHARPARVDNEAKGCLDDIALQLMREPGATLVIVGKHNEAEKPEAAAERGLNIKQYMTNEKRIDNGRIQVRTGETTARIADNILVPQGATWDPVGTASFDPYMIQRHGEPYSVDTAKK